MTSHASTTSSRNELMRLPGYEDARRNCAPGSAGNRRGFCHGHPKFDYLAAHRSARVTHGFQNELSI